MEFLLFLILAVLGVGFAILLEQFHSLRKQIEKSAQAHEWSTQKAIESATKELAEIAAAIERLRLRDRQ